MKTRVILSLLFLLSFGSVRAADLFIEAESFSNKGGWKVDQQFMDLMGSPYLLAHGMGVPVDDASTEVTFPEKGEYYVYVRTYNWTSPWKKGEGPGKFSLSVGASATSRQPLSGGYATLLLFARQSVAYPYAPAF